MEQFAPGQQATVELAHQTNAAGIATRMVPSVRQEEVGVCVIFADVERIDSVLMLN